VDNGESTCNPSRAELASLSDEVLLAFVSAFLVGESGHGWGWIVLGNEMERPVVEGRAQRLDNASYIEGVAHEPVVDGRVENWKESGMNVYPTIESVLYGRRHSSNHQRESKDAAVEDMVVQGVAVEEAVQARQAQVLEALLWTERVVHDYT
jgi:hypothetical protein